jgi:hypothetical protein
MLGITHHGDVPYVVRGVQQDYIELFYQPGGEDRALFIPIHLQAGYGVLPVGTIMAKNLSAAGSLGQYVPYNPTTASKTGDQRGRAFLIADAGTAYVVNVSIEDSYKFTVGDDICIDDDNSAEENLGAITAIDRTTYVTYAVITFTTAISGDFDISQNAFVCVEAGTSTNHYSDAVGVLMSSVNTGSGINSKGGHGQLLLSNAIIYTGALFLTDAAAKTAIGYSSYGNLSVLK